MINVSAWSHYGNCNIKANQILVYDRSLILTTSVPFVQTFIYDIIPQIHSTSDACLFYIPKYKQQKLGKTQWILTGYKTTV